MLMSNTSIEDLKTILIRNNDDLLKRLGTRAPLSTGILFCMAALQRIASNAHGFEAMFVARNYPVLAAILRMQIDTAMRLNGLKLMTDVDEGTMSLIAGGRYDAIRDRHNKRLRDADLLAALVKQHPWVEEVYRRTSGLIHLSGTHIHHALDHGQATKDDGGLSIQIVISPTGPKLPSALFDEALDAFVHATAIASAEALTFISHDVERLTPRTTG